jgi:hypothetical protein
MVKDWKGNSKSIYAPLGASNHSERERQEHDYYATHPRAVELLLQLEKFEHSIWEPACGEGHISKVLSSAGHQVKSSDLIDRSFGEGGIDFLGADNQEWSGSIISNPPYSKAKEFIQKSIDITKPGSKIAMFLKLQFMESKGRKALFINTPPHTIYISSSRLNCAMNGDFEGQRIRGEGSAVGYAWYVWVNGFKGTTQVKWFN